MSSLIQIQKVARSYAREKAEENLTPETDSQSGESSKTARLQSLQAEDNAAGSGQRRASLSHNPESMIQRLLTAYDVSNKPGQADVEINGVPTKPDWDEPESPMSQDAVDEEEEDENENINRQAVRKALACLMNEADNLPGIGRRIDRIVRQVGTADIYFDDGSWVSATVDDPEPQTSGQQAVVDAIYNQGGGCSGGCGGRCSKHAKLETVDMIAATRGDEFLSAIDSNKAGARSPYYWKVKVGTPFDLWLLRRIPLDLAEQIADFGLPSSRLRKGRDVWKKLRRYAAPRPFKSLSG